MPSLAVVLAWVAILLVQQQQDLARMRRRRRCTADDLEDVDMEVFVAGMGNPNPRFRGGSRPGRRAVKPRETGVWDNIDRYAADDYTWKSIFRCREYVTMAPLIAFKWKGHR